MIAKQNSNIELKITINEQVLSKIIAEVVKALAQPTTPGVPGVPNASQQSQQIEALQKQVANLQKELAQAKANASKAEPGVPPAREAQKPMPSVAAQAVAEPQEPGAPAAKQSAPQSAPPAQVQPCEAQSQVKPGEAQSQAEPQDNGNGNGKYVPPNTLKAEQWAHEHVAEWLNQPCNFAKANGRSWKELAENVGEKIVINGKASQPRAYLHVLESWNDCNGWARTKAKVALEVIPSKNGTKPVEASK